jgi:hypothetical protein
MYIDSVILILGNFISIIVVSISVSDCFWVTWTIECGRECSDLVVAHIFSPEISSSFLIRQLD